MRMRVCAGLLPALLAFVLPSLTMDAHADGRGWVAAQASKQDSREGDCLENALQDPEIAFELSREYAEHLVSVAADSAELRAVHESLWDRPHGDKDL